MKTYNVKDIADMLQTNPETVRRWIRAGKLKADQSSRKDGNIVREDDLYKYLRSTSKYAAIAAGLVATNPLLALTSAVGASFFGAVLKSLTTRSTNNEPNIRALSDEVERTLKKYIVESEEIIRRKEAAIDELKEEIEKEQQHIKEYKITLEHLAEALSVVEKTN